MNYKHKNPSKADQTAQAEKYPQKEFREKPCRHCGETFKPKAPSELYCSDECKDSGYSTAYLKRVYGITLLDYNTMFESQGGVCKICGDEGFLMDSERHKIKLVVDHNHITGAVRGLLCHNCNRALGLLQDNTDVLRSAINYLERCND